MGTQCTVLRGVLSHGVRLLSPGSLLHAGTGDDYLEARRLNTCLMKLAVCSQHALEVCRMSEVY
eukprot:696620-Amphidinium_carterae.1